jgi:hypothetical protein
MVTSGALVFTARNTSMVTRKFALTMVCMSAALYPAISDALPRQRLLDACVNAFEKTLATPAAETRSYKVIYRGDRYPGSLLEFYYPTAYSFDLLANDPKTGTAFAHVRCDVNRAGVVTALAQMPPRSNRETTTREAAGDSHLNAY